MGRRVSKDPEIRKEEIVIAAFELFRESSFDQVSVNDIVKKVGLAQGTFYYHFKSKYDLLDAVVEYEMRQNLAAVKKIAADDKLGILEKMQGILRLDVPDEARNRFVRLIQSEENAVMHRKYQTKMAEELVPCLTKVVEDGKREGVFDVQYPREIVQLLFDMQIDLERLLASTADRDSAYRLIRAAEDIYVRVMGVRPGSIRLIS